MNVDVFSPDDLEHFMGMREGMLYGFTFRDHQCPSCSPIENPTPQEATWVREWWLMEEALVRKTKRSRCIRKSP